MGELSECVDVQNWDGDAERWESVLEKEANEDPFAMASDDPQNADGQSVRESLPCRVRSHIRSVVDSSSFELLIGLVILANCVNIGLDQHNRLHKDSLEYVETMENIFIAIYVIELVLRFTSHGVYALRDRWVIFDCLLVTCSVFFQWVYPLLAGFKMTEAEPLTLLRAMRLVRVARAIRVLYQFRTLWMLLMGLLGSAGTVVYTLVIMILLFFVFGVAGIELTNFNAKAIETSEFYDPEFRELTDKYFSSVVGAMMTLMQFATADTINEVYRGFIVKEPYLVFYFGLVIVVVQIALMNLVTGVIVNSAMEQANSNKEAEKVLRLRQKKLMLRKIRKALKRIDEDHSGEISLQEMMDMSDSDWELLVEVLKGCRSEDPLALFKAVDVEDRGVVDIEEMCQHIWKEFTSKVPANVAGMQQVLSFCVDQSKAFLEQQDEVMEELDRMQQALRRAETRLNVSMLHAAERAPGGEIGKPPARFSEGESACQRASADSLLSAETLSTVAEEPRAASNEKVLALKRSLRDAAEGNRFADVRALADRIEALVSASARPRLVAGLGSRASDCSGCWGLH
jgi:voltage-gated sodium channel